MNIKFPTSEELRDFEENVWWFLIGGIWGLVAIALISEFPAVIGAIFGTVLIFLAATIVIYSLLNKNVK